jgi:hypothetical protein
MRFSRPRTGTILGAIALFIALGGTAFAASATVVNIADPTTPAHKAQVNSSGQLQTSGSTSITNTVSTELAPSSAFLHGENGAQSSRCSVVLTPPQGKAMIVRQVRINVFADPSPGESQDVAIFTGIDCNSFVGEVTPPTAGETILPFDPGLGIPAKSGLSAETGGSVEAQVFADGYSVPSIQVATSGVRSTGIKAPPRHQR